MLEIGPDVLRQLVKHFDAFVRAAISETVGAADDPNMFNQDTIEKHVWDLAGKVTAELEDAFNTTQGECKYAIGAAYVQDMIDLVVDDVQRDFLTGSGGLRHLIAIASGAKDDYRFRDVGPGAPGDPPPRLPPHL